MPVSPRHFRLVRNITTSATHQFNDNGDNALFHPDSIPAVADILHDGFRGIFYAVRQIEPALSSRGRICHYTATLQKCNVTCTIQRFAVDAKDAFGREIDPHPATIAFGIHGVFETTGPDSAKLVTPVTEARLNDRLVITGPNNNSKTYRVLAIDSTSPGFTVYKLAQDFR